MLSHTLLLFNITLAVTATNFDDKIFADYTMVKISDCFHYIITLCYVIKWLARFANRQVSGNLQIVQCNLQIGWPIYQLADWQIGRNIFTNVPLDDTTEICINELYHHLHSVPPAVE